MRKQNKVIFFSTDLPVLVFYMHPLFVFKSVVYIRVITRRKKISYGITATKLSKLTGSLKFSECLKVMKIPNYCFIYASYISIHV